MGLAEAPGRLASSLAGAFLFVFYRCDDTQHIIVSWVTRLAKHDIRELAA